MQYYSPLSRGHPAPRQRLVHVSLAYCHLHVMVDNVYSRVSVLYRTSLYSFVRRKCQVCGDMGVFRVLDWHWHSNMLCEILNIRCMEAAYEQIMKINVEIVFTTLSFSLISHGETNCCDLKERGQNSTPCHSNICAYVWHWIQNESEIIIDTMSDEPLWLFRLVSDLANDIRIIRWSFFCMICIRVCCNGGCHKLCRWSVGKNCPSVAVTGT